MWFVIATVSFVLGLVVGFCAALWWIVKRSEWVEERFGLPEWPDRTVINIGLQQVREHIADFEATELAQLWCIIHDIDVAIRAHRGMSTW